MHAVYQICKNWNVIYCLSRSGFTFLSFSPLQTYRSIFVIFKKKNHVNSNKAIECNWSWRRVALTELMFAYRMPCYILHDNNSNHSQCLERIMLHKMTERNVKEKCSFCIWRQHDKRYYDRYANEWERRKAEKSSPHTHTQYSQVAAKSIRCRHSHSKSNYNF